MKTNIFRSVVAGLAILSFVGASSSAMAGGWGDWRDREIHRAERRIDQLRVERDRAADHHRWREVKRIDAAIDHQRDIIRRDRRH